MGWKEKTISKAGREILIKSMAQTIPTYSTSIFKFQESCVMVLTQFWPNIGRDKIGVKRGFIGLIGRKCAHLKRREIWGLEIFTHLTLLC